MKLPTLVELKAALDSFAASPATFRVLHTVPSISAGGTRGKPNRLYVLDSSYNPPTRAHLRIAISALTEDDAAAKGGPRSLLLLLATQNADKDPKPASFEQRLALMTAFAHDILGQLAQTCPTEAVSSVVDVGLTKLPYFHDKAQTIDSSSVYSETSTEAPRQVHLIGFDTLIRILNPQYYPPQHTLAPLNPFLDRHRLRVTYRTDATWGDRAEQDGYLRDLARGERETEGGKREWADRIQLVDGRKVGEEVISSTKAREAASRGDLKALESLVTDRVFALIAHQRLYRDEE